MEGAASVSYFESRFFVLQVLIEPVLAVRPSVPNCDFVKVVCWWLTHSNGVESFESSIRELRFRPDSASNIPQSPIVQCQFHQRSIVRTRQNDQTSNEARRESIAYSMPSRSQYRGA